uniref:Putative amphiphysin n=1 Tax=Amblyomma triste TaxID=251400 RepID=A0A023G3A6_AMBTT
MADGKGGSFTKVVQKHAGRAKERILQNLGRADKTKDEVFEVYMYNFSRQQTAAAKLQKEFKNYVLCIKSLQLASKALMDTLSEIYEQEWVGHEQIPVKAQTLELLWDDYHRKMNDQVMIPLNSYINQFTDVRGRIAKRGRKLVDYDKCRHSVESLRNSAKKKDDYKLGKAREELEEAKQMYEVINNELHEELPALYDSRIPFLVSNLQTFFTAESTFHAENAKVFSFLVETMQKLASSEGQASTKGLSYNMPNSVSKEADTRPYEEIEFKKGKSNRASDISIKVTETNGQLSSPSPLMVSPVRSAARLENEDSALVSPPGFRASYVGSDRNGETPHHRRDEKDYEPVDVGAQMNSDGDKQAATADELYDIPVGATTTDLPAGVLYRVRATYKYTAEDVDELNFESGEIIRVIEYDDPEEQEEGWLMGIKESTGEKGLFPANFTRPI